MGNVTIERTGEVVLQAHRRLSGAYQGAMAWRLSGISTVEVFWLCRENHLTTREARACAMNELVDRIHAGLTDELRRTPWRGSPNPLAGHCYVASEALYHALGGPASGLTPEHIQHEGASHWYLRQANGPVIDITAAQFQTPVPYHQGRGKGFLTSQPSKRAQVVLSRIAQ